MNKSRFGSILSVYAEADFRDENVGGFSELISKFYLNVRDTW